MQWFHIKPGECRFQFDNGVVVHIRNDDDGLASVVAWDSGGQGWEPGMGKFYPLRRYPSQTLTAYALVEFLGQMATYTEREVVHAEHQG